jgi:adenosylcobalamin-dependent ribonucleoside-triphosphate reductase
MSTVRRFRLSEEFIEPYKTRPVAWGNDSLGYIIFKRTYARRLNEQEPGTDGTEEWWQTCRRVIEGMFNTQKQHISLLGLEWNNQKAQRTAKEAYERLFVMKWMPPGRGLWMMGTRFAEERTGAALMNCAFRSTKDLAARGPHLFAWIMDALMLGVGVGFDTLGANTVYIQEPKHNGGAYTIPDSREGWVESVRLLLDAYFNGNELPRYDYSLIRKAGAPIEGFGGTSSGHQPLKQLHEDLCELLEQRIGEAISSVDIVDIENLIGKCVVAGNVRRSAALGLGLPNDKPFLTMKNDEEKLLSHRWGSNLSINAPVGLDYDSLAQQTALKGEPAYFWLKNAQTHGRFADPPNDSDQAISGVNPCGEMQLEDGECCNVAEIIINKHKDLNDLKRSIKIAYLYAKTVTLTKTHWPETNAKMLKNRRIGLSMSGLAIQFDKIGYRTVYSWLDKSYAYLKELDALYSDWLCVPRSKRMTTIKPGGTTPKLPGVTAGVHYPEAIHYLRRVRFSEQDLLLPPLIKAGYPIEKDIYSPNTQVISFPVKIEGLNRTKKDLTMWEQLEIVAQVQHYWSDNAVSVTVSFTNEEASQIKYALQLYETRLKGVSFLPKQVIYKQAPIEPITEEEYLALIQTIQPVTNINTNQAGIGEKYCDGDSCQL